jgi:asparaginyl-tRNA synthetase
MKKTQINILNKEFQKYEGKQIKIAGWARTIRDSKSIAFIELNDGAFKSCQVVLSKDTINNFDDIIKQLTGTAFEIIGSVVITPNAKQMYEINLKKLKLLVMN